MFTSVTPEEFQKYISDEKVVVIDVRTSAELDIYGIIDENQLHMDCNSAQFTTDIMQLDKSQTFAVYCWHGNRSKAVANFMVENGFTSIIELDKGIDAWNKVYKS